MFAFGEKMYSSIVADAVFSSNTPVKNLRYAS